MMIYDEFVYNEKSNVKAHKSTNKNHTSFENCEVQGSLRIRISKIILSMHKYVSVCIVNKKQMCK